MSSRPPVSPRNYSKPWQRRGRSPRKARKLKCKELWSSKPRTHKKATQETFKADFPPPPRHSAIGGHHVEYQRPLSRGTYQQPKYGHIKPFSTHTRPSTALGLVTTATTPEDGASSDSDEDDGATLPADALPLTPATPSTAISDTARSVRTYEPGSTVLPRRPTSPFTPFDQRTSEERQKIALVKLRSLYDGRQQFQKIYQSWDLNRDGGIDVDEFQTQLHHHGFEWLTNQDVDDLFHRFVPKDKHVLDYKSFRDFMFAHAIEDTVWDSTFDPFKSDKNYGWKSPRLKRHQKKFTVTDPNPWRRDSSSQSSSSSSSNRKSNHNYMPPPMSPLRRPPPAELPEQLQDVMSEHGEF